MSDYIVQKKLGWYLKLRIPKDLRKYYLTCKAKPKEYLEQTLKTRDRAEAKKNARQLVAMYELEFEHLRNDRRPSTSEFIEEHVVKKHREWARGYITYPFGEFDPGEYWNLAVEHQEEPLSDFEKRKMNMLWKSFNNPTALTLQELIDKYLDERRSVLREASWNERQAELKEFADWWGGGLPVSLIEKKDAGRYVVYLSNKVSKRTKQQLSSKTIRDILSGISSMFNWAEARGGIRIESLSRPFSISS